MARTWERAPLKLASDRLLALQQLARLRSARSGKRVTLSSLLRPLVDEFLAQNQAEVSQALALLDEEAASRE